MRINFRDWRVWAGLIGAIVAAVLAYFGIGCAQSVPVIVQQQHFECSNVVDAGGGSVSFTGCQSTNGNKAGQGDTDQDADGQVDLPIHLDIKPKGTSWRCTLQRERYASMLN